jgi:hypothetical protein
MGYRYLFTLPYGNLQIGHRLHKEEEKLKKIKKVNSENNVSSEVNSE